MSKSPYLSNPNILAHPDRIVQKVELDMTAQDSYLAGSPISAEGKLANDASAIGILLYDVHKAIGGNTGVVVIFGRIQQDVAAEHSGITISAEAKAALIDITFTGDGSRMGGGGLSALPEGYPYKEGEKHIITWDGNPEGKVDVADGMYTKVSDLTPSFDELKPLFIGGVGEYEDGGFKEDYSKYIDREVFFSSDAVKATVFFAIAYKDNAIAEIYEETVVFPEKGLYFGNMYHYGRVGYMEWGAETVKTIDPKFLPEGYPYKEHNVGHITWDGETEGLENPSYEMFKVSDTVLTASSLIGQKVVIADKQGNPVEEVVVTAGMVEEFDDGLFFYYDGMLWVRCVYENQQFPAGTYFFLREDYDIRVSDLSYVSENIYHPMAEEYIQLTSPNGTKYKLAVSDNGTLSAVAVS